MLIGGQDILLPTTMVGNYPHPRWYDGHGFAVLPKGEFIHDSISADCACARRPTPAGSM